jgi:hypothetical protein
MAPLLQSENNSFARRPIAAIQIDNSGSDPIFWKLLQKVL